jgi:DNA/RNA-binding domain of Phe-tRNA-synthetase-like protein
VALYNTISLRYILPVGGEDLDQIVGDIWLTVAGDNEPAVRLLGEKEARPPYPGEIIYKDEASTICRRWNWKEADRTQLTQATRHAFLVIEAIPPIPKVTVESATRELAELIQHYAGGTVRTTFLDRTNPAATL